MQRTHSATRCGNRFLEAVRYLLAGVAIHSGCTSNQQAVTALQVRDSLGVQIVENHAPRWADGQAWRIDSVPAVTVGTSPDPREELSAVRDIVPLSTGGFALVNAGTSQLRYYDPTGVLIQAVGRQGQGPGEFRDMWTLVRCAGDTLVVNDGVRVDLFGSDGGFVRRSRVHRATGVRSNVIYGVSDDCSRVLLMVQIPREASTAVYQMTETLYWSALAAPQLDTVVTFPGDDLKGFDVMGVRYGLWVPFGMFPVWTTDGRLVYLARSDQAEVQVFDRRGALIRLIRWTVPSMPVSAKDREAFQHGRDEVIRRNPNEARFAPPLDRFPEVTTRPLFSRIMVDASGTLWVREYPVSQAGFPRGYRRPEDGHGESWTVIDSSGTWLGTISVPAGLDVRAIGPRAIFGVSTTEEGVERVEAYRILRR